jgi:hypothetical protein
MGKGDQSTKLWDLLWQTQALRMLGSCIRPQNWVGNPWIGDKQQLFQLGLEQRLVASFCVF